MGYLTPKQENAIEGIIRKTNWECPEPLPADLVDTGRTIDLIVTPGHVPSADVIERLRAQVEAEGRAFGGVYIDPVHKSIEDSANGGRININREDKFLSSVVSREIPFTGYHHTKVSAPAIVLGGHAQRRHRAAAAGARDGIPLSCLQPGQNQQQLADRWRTVPISILISSLQNGGSNGGVQEKRRTRTAYA
jgi:hypothetical protein